MKSIGCLTYDPVSDEADFDQWWAILECDDGIVHYYRYWLQKYWPIVVPSIDWMEKSDLVAPSLWPINTLGVRLSRSVWGTHISVVRGEEPLNKDIWCKYQGQSFEYEYDPYYINSNGKHWWTRIISSDLEQLRYELGLTPQPQKIYPDGSRRDKPFHLTIGYRI